MAHAVGEEGVAWADVHAAERRAAADAAAERAADAAAAAERHEVVVACDG